MTTAITKVTSHISPNEQLIFERSQTGRIGYRLPALDVDEVELNIPAEFRRDDDLEGMPEVSEVDVIRHFVRMSTWNYSIDLGMYPLGSCTMKYNSRLNERVAREATPFPRSETGDRNPPGRALPRSKCPQFLSD